MRPAFIGVRIELQACCPPADIHSTQAAPNIEGILATYLNFLAGLFKTQADTNVAFGIYAGLSFSSRQRKSLSRRDKLIPRARIVGKS